MKTNLIIALSGLITIFAPVGPLLTISLISIFLDVCFGVWRSWRKRADQEVKFWDVMQSQRLFATAVKAIIYSGAIIRFTIISTILFFIP